MTPLWTSVDAARATGGTARGDWVASGVSIDTRTLEPGDLFVALKHQRDGHDFVAQALSRGAAAALVSHVPADVAEDAPLLVVPDVLEALRELGRAARARTQARVIAVTGSVGKTSTKDMLRASLAPQGATHAAEKSYNNHWGVPLTLARMPTATDFAVIEIGMNRPGEIAPLSRLARPHVAIVTTVAPAHLEAFGRIEGIAHEKASIFEGLEPRGTAIFHGDVATAPILADYARRHGARSVTFGTGGRNHHRATEIAVHGDTTVAAARLWRTPVHYRLQTPGHHLAVNALAVLAAVAAVGADRARAILALSSWQPTGGRGTREVIVLDTASDEMSAELIDDAFNANPASMSAALDMLAAAEPKDGIGRVTRGRRVAVLGDMLELGEAETAMHAAIAEHPAMPSVAVVHCVGPRMRTLWQALPDSRRGLWTETAAELAAKAHDIVDAGDVVLVKGSKGSRVSEVVDAIRKLGHPAPDAEVGDL